MKNKAWKLHGKVSFFRHLEELVVIHRVNEEIFRFTPESIFFFDSLRVPRTIAQLIPQTFPARTHAEAELLDLCRSLEERHLLISSKAVAILPPPEVFSFPRLLDSLAGVFVAKISTIGSSIATAN